MDKKGPPDEVNALEKRTKKEKKGGKKKKK